MSTPPERFRLVKRLENGEYVPITDDDLGGGVSADELAAAVADRAVVDEDGQLRDPATGTLIPVVSQSTFAAVDLPVTGRLTRLEGYGHSIMAGETVTATQRFLRLVANNLDADEENHGVGGSTIVGNLVVQLEGALARQPGSDPSQAAMVMWGINDLAAFGASVIPAVAAAHRMLISRIRCAPGDVHPYNDSAIAYGAGWNDFQSRFKATAGNANATITVAASKAGRYVSVPVVAVQGQGAVHTLTAGSSTATLDTRGLYPGAPAPSSAQLYTCVRVWVPPQVTTITLTVTNVVGGTYVYGWQLEAATPPIVGVLKQYRLPSYATYTESYYQPVDADVLALNAALDQVVGEFDQSVFTIDTDALYGRSTALVALDLIHSSVAGNEVLAKAVETSLRSWPAVGDQTAVRKVAKDLATLSGSVASRDDVGSNAAALWGLSDDKKTGVTS